ncbi:16S rRNA (adenine(1518)-N(6)/adenine(1519)-N(6))-dimethyltransferase RsmA [Fangia hongkongensis]|uniref:16S rRNA (adenine(1518)-N(6)/adenine(1519)-N(6))- dimethyltransferase RsmA n=1 Tax=Fangia hongkongensis TaxID=270495 RepID=UPI000364715D|nr:16S rRNA (adenine(1518)-N(6)/adenine(1519)-N(6))-dimethyltransferase RsmA [Fangia hongkongensis]MBK2124145.1 16S rRNA (adenine(1518)-N(6)/adenine(1519)-N(6))-dimethyltransferase RsmA [Fangia hongkongensis]
MPHKAKKSLGQNFLQDQNIIHKIIHEAHISAGDNVIEIGPGLGALTTHILKRAKSLSVIEYDGDVIPVLKDKTKAIGTLNIIHQDILTVQFDQLFHEDKIKLIGNLPYNISSQILFHLIPFARMFKNMHFMLQKEVVDRITASPNNKTYGRLSVMLQYYFQTEGLFIVPPNAFYPAPKVDSKIIRLTPFSSLPFKAKNEALFAKIVKQTFEQRRKTLRNTLKPFVTDSSTLLLAPIDITKRPENLSVKDFVALSNFIEEKQCQPM